MAADLREFAGSTLPGDAERRALQRQEVGRDIVAAAYILTTSKGGTPDQARSREIEDHTSGVPDVVPAVTVPTWGRTYV